MSSFYENMEAFNQQRSVISNNIDSLTFYFK